ncbi:MAG: TetR/AcrR family transcriptional regulator [Bacteroidales bacterium]|jgi:AcrR family transcriptional regulator|nr:TetR/AcrR family transcriptional regulator [Bacteroidales bacterium]
MPQDDTRERIVTAARELFARFGYRKTTIDDIAQAHGKAKSSVYYYFKGKEDIFEAVIESEARILRQKLSEVLREERNDPMEQLSRYVRVRMGSIQEMASFYSMMKDEYLSTLQFIHKTREKYYLKEISTLETIIKHGINKGVFEDKNPHSAAMAILTSIHGMEHPLFLGYLQSRDLKARLNDALDIIFYGIVKRNP